MTGKIKIDYTKICPLLRAKGIKKLEPLVVYPETGRTEGGNCENGGNNVDADIASDLMLKPKTLDIEVSCTGCKELEGGFTITIQEKNPTV
jgi:hypothetical protein